MSEIKVFSYTGSNQYWTVPDRVSSLYLELYGAQGGVPLNVGNQRAAGGFTVATLPVVPGQEITIIVGGRGQDANGTIGGIGGFGYGHGGAGGTGAGGTAPNRGGGGGGGSTAVIFDGFPLVAGGAAGRAGTSLYLETYGGGLQGGETTNAPGGKGGTQTAAGLGGVSLLSGSDGSGPHGGDGASDLFFLTSGGGGGGGGFWGGGGGALDNRFSYPGGGGSGYAGSQDGPDYPFLNALTVPGINDQGNGLVIIFYTVIPGPDPDSITVFGRIPPQSLVTSVCQEVSITARVSGLGNDYDFQGSSMTFEVVGPFATIGDLFQSCEDTPSLVTRVGVVPITSSVTSSITSSSTLLEVESPAFTPTAAGIYRWKIVFQNEALQVSSLCSNDSLIFSVNKVVPSLTRYIGTRCAGYEEYNLYRLWLSGGCDPQSTIECHLEYNGSIVYQESIKVNGNGLYYIQGPPSDLSPLSSLPFHFSCFDLFATRIWKCSFMGDVRNHPVTLCLKC